MATNDKFSKRIQSETEEKEQKQEKDKPMLEKCYELTSELPIFPTDEMFTIRLFLVHWRFDAYIPGIMAMRDHFRARPDDTLLASYHKCSTTWLKALIYSTTNRSDHPLHLHPLHTHNPHDLVQHLEDQYMAERFPDLGAHPSPRIFHTHVFYSDLPDSMKEKCKIVYICREPKDNFTSLWHFFEQGHFQKGCGQPTTTSVSLYCEGKVAPGSIWDHMIGYWNAHKEDPTRVMFLRYEDLKRDVKGVVRRLGEFLGCPFTEEEREGVAEGMVQLCSVESLKGMKVNVKERTGVRFKVESRIFCRKSDVGDWVNLLTTEMREMIDKVTEEKLVRTGLSFHV